MSKGRRAHPQKPVQKVPDHKGKPYCDVIYRQGAIGIDFSSARRDHKYRWKKAIRHFKDYGTAIAHLTNIKLQIEEDVYPWTHREPVLISHGTLHNGQKKAKVTKHLISKEEREREPNERDCFRWTGDDSGRLASQWTNPLLSVSKGCTVGSIHTFFNGSNFATTYYTGGGRWAVTSFDAATKLVDTGSCTINIPV